MWMFASLAGVHKKEPLNVQCVENEQQEDFVISRGAWYRSSRRLLLRQQHLLVVRAHVARVIAWIGMFERAFITALQ